MNFALYLLALNRRLLAKGREEADEGRARDYFEERLTVEQAENLEAIEQELQAINGDGPASR